MSGTEKLVRMANQIARNFEIQGKDEAADMTADHILRFWDPRMRETLIRYSSEGGEGLSDIARAAMKAVSDHRPGTVH